MKAIFKKEKDCTNSIRFAPEDDTVLGRSPIYIDKDKLVKLGINPEKGFEMTIEAKKSKAPADAPDEGPKKEPKS